MISIQQTLSSQPASGIYFFSTAEELDVLFPEETVREVVGQKLGDQEKSLIQQGVHHMFVEKLELKTETADLETYRLRGFDCWNHIKQEKINALNFYGVAGLEDEKTAFLEGLILGSYTFQVYKKEKNEHDCTLHIPETLLSAEKLEELNQVTKAVFHARDLVNEPANKLTATDFATRMAAMGSEAGFTTNVLEMAQIESLKMGGLLSVNQGSTEPPTFTVMEHKPENAFNQNPIVLVGKGVVYDTGGHSLKPTPNSMDFMKADMGGGAAVAGAMYAIAANELPVWVIGLVPASDNRISADAYSPGDVITMHDGSTVEVMNTDAEGRLLLADALSYAKKYDPMFAIDLATLTGSAVRAIGTYGAVAMGTADDAYKNSLMKAASKTHERIAEFPFWPEYGKELASQIADLKNLGAPEGGAISAGKFLAHFVDYEWLHLDIAGPAYLPKPDAYRGLHGTGFGVRLLFEFVKELIDGDGKRA